MSKIREAPAPLRRKIYLTAIIGIVCFLVGLAMFLFLKDKMMLFLSLVICTFSIGKVIDYYRIIAGEDYETVEGTCVSITPKPLRKYRKIKIMDDNGVESSLLLNKQSKIRIGYRYRFYFKETQHISLGSEYLDSALSSDCFLGYEELGEFSEQAEENGL